MLPMIIFFLILLFAVYYVALEFILFKGRQHNRFFATFLNTFIPVFGSVPAYIMACKYERRMFREKCKLNNLVIRIIISLLQLVSVLALLMPLFQIESVAYSGIDLIFGNADGDQNIKPMLFFVYLIALPFISIILNLASRKKNIANFFAYSVSMLNGLTVLVMNMILSVDIAECSAYIWLYCILNVVIMGLTMISLVAVRDTFLFKLEYSEKIEYIKEQQRKKESHQENEPDESTYKCARCGNLVKKGSICECIEHKQENADNLQETAGNVIEKNEIRCVNCNRVLAPGEKCNCMEETISVELKADTPAKRKCIYCGQTLVGESTCICEKIMKNSQPAKSEDGVEAEPKKYFESQIEESTTVVSDELAELEKKINQRFEKLMKKMETTSKE